MAKKSIKLEFDYISMASLGEDPAQDIVKEYIRPKADKDFWAACITPPRLVKDIPIDDEHYLSSGFKLVACHSNIKQGESMPELAGKLAQMAKAYAKTQGIELEIADKAEFTHSHGGKIEVAPKF
jgi:hypothetical protein